MTNEVTVRFCRICAALFLVILVVESPKGYCAATFDRVMKAGRIRLGLPYNHIPQGFLSPNGEWIGFEVDLGSEMAKRMNLTPELTKVNDKTWTALLSGGQIDAAFCRIRQTRSLERDFDFSIPYFFDSLQMLIPKGQFKTPADLKGHKIAAVQGSSAEKSAMLFLRMAGDENAEKNVMSFPDRPAIFMALGRAKVSGWVDSGIILLEYCSKTAGHFEMMSVSESLEPIAVGLPQDDSAWRDLINFTLQDIYQDGSFKKIYDKWFGPNTAHAFPAKRPIDIWPH